MCLQAEGLQLWVVVKALGQRVEEALGRARPSERQQQRGHVERGRGRVGVANVRGAEVVQCLARRRARLEQQRPEVIVRLRVQVVERHGALVVPARKFQPSGVVQRGAGVVPQLVVARAQPQRVTQLGQLAIHIAHLAARPCPLLEPAAVLDTARPARRQKHNEHPPLARGEPVAAVPDGRRVEQHMTLGQRDGLAERLDPGATSHVVGPAVERHNHREQRRVTVHWLVRQPGRRIVLHHKRAVDHQLPGPGPAAVAARLPAPALQPPAAEPAVDGAVAIRLPHRRLEHR
eukprot:scaffold10630_cov90-Isochrysis_galbana.AAC.2